MENFANFLFLFNQETRKLIRNIENIEKKLINCQLAVVFKETCLNEEILPIYTNILYIQCRARVGCDLITGKKKLVTRKSHIVFTKLRAQWMRCNHSGINQEHVCVQRYIMVKSRDSRSFIYTTKNMFVYRDKWWLSLETREVWYIQPWQCLFL